MKVQYEVEINPFTVPNFVTTKEQPKGREEGFKPSDGIPLSALDSFTLDKLCEDFKNEVFRKSGKDQLPQSLCEHCG